MNNITNESTYGRPCVDGLCYCDWRLTLTNCYDENVFRYIGIVIIAVTSCIVIVGAGLLYHRLVNLKQVIFEYRNNFVRPRAMESILFFNLLFNILRLIDTIVLVTDTAQNIIFRQFLFEFSYEMGFTCLGVYLFGIIHALRESDRAIFDQWIYSSLFADILCTSIIVGPYLTNTICSLGAGISEYLGYTEQASIFAQTLYTVWAFHCIALASLTLYAGWRLIQILHTHITRKEESSTNIDVSKVKLGASKVKIIAFTSSICLYLYAGVSFTYATIRVRILTHIPVSLLFFISWNGLGMVASIFIVFAVILNPKMKLTLLFTTGSSGQLRSHGMELDSSRKNTSGTRNKHNNNKHVTSTNQGNSMTATANGTYIDSTFETHTFDDSVLYSSKIRDMDTSVPSDDPNRNYTSMDAAPTLSTAIAMQYSNRSNPLVLDDNDAELMHAYPESTKSCSHLVKEKDVHGYP